MVEFKSNYSFAGLILAIALIVGGITYNLVPTGNYKVCDNGVGWKLTETGQYSCGDRKYDCVAVRNTKTGKSNYYCDEATRVEVKEVVKIVEQQCPSVVCPRVRVIKYDYDGTKWLCNDLGQNCVEWSELADTNFRFM